MLSYLMTIVFGERIFRYVSPGTHQFEKYIKDEELVAMLGGQGHVLYDITDYTYDPVRGKWMFVPWPRVNYFVTTRKSATK